MTPFHLLRTAVKLSLIVALTFQPVVTLASGAECGTAANTCHECGCCEVENAAALCGCCGGLETAESPQHGHSCCAESTEGVASPQKPQRSGAVDRSEANRRAESGLHAVARGAGRTAATGVQRSCLCQQSSQPLIDGHSSRPGNESRQTLAVGYLHFDATTLGVTSVNPGDRAESVLLGLEYGTQALLCIWRL